MRFFPLLVFAMLFATLQMQLATMRLVSPNAQLLSVNAYALQFLNYRAAVMAYVTANPSYTGTLPSSTLTSFTHQQFASAFLTTAGNDVTVSGTGREITVYAALPTGTLSQLLTLSGNDASIGLSSGTTWTTKANGIVATAQPLPLTVTSGDVVSVLVQ